MQLNPYLTFNGQCEAAFKFYEHCLGGKIEAMLPFEGTEIAEKLAPEWRGKIMHARLNLDGNILMASDGMPGQPYDGMTGFSVSLNVDDPAEAERLFYALAENGIVSMPIQPTFWAARFGMLTDQFGTPWMINCE